MIFRTVNKGKRIDIYDIFVATTGIPIRAAKGDVQWTVVCAEQRVVQGGLKSLWRCDFPEGRVSIPRWNLKGMRRSTGL